jgi:hypothetical protein
LRIGGFYSNPRYLFERSIDRLGSHAAVIAAPRFRTDRLPKAWLDEVAPASPRCGRSALLKGTSQMRERSRFGMPVPQTLKGL